MTNEQKEDVLDAVRKASSKWKIAFNSGDASGCAEVYEKYAVMYAKPFGTFTGKTEIQSFWQRLINDGFSNVDYIDPAVSEEEKEIFYKMFNGMEGFYSVR